MAGMARKAGFVDIAVIWLWHGMTYKLPYVLRWTLAAALLSGDPFAWRRQLVAFLTA